MKAQFCHKRAYFLCEFRSLNFTQSFFFLPSTEESRFTKIKRNMSHLLF